jgi:hypothetical protein
VQQTDGCYWNLAEIKSTKLKKGEHVSVYKDRLMIMKWKNKTKIFVL